MTSLFTAHTLSKTFGSKALFDDISFTCVEGDRIGMFGPNGSGKSTLLKILGGVESADSGFITKRQGLRIGYASQVPEFSDLSLENALLEGTTSSLGDVTKARILLSKMQFENPEQSAQTLSGGWKKRLDIARALMQDPDILLLDEPTNHLDLEGILWLEKFLSRERIAYIVVSHDRYFLEAVSNKTIELNRCYPQGLLIHNGTMSSFLEYKEGFLKAQEEQQRSLAGLVRQETEWLRRSPKARTTKSVARIQRAHQLMEDLSDVKQRNQVQKVSLEFSDSDRATKKLLSGKNIGKSLGGKLLFKNLDITLSPGLRLGIVGNNGTGKSTLLKILAGMIPQDTGTVKLAQDLNLVYFDQHREQLPPHISIKEALSATTDTVNYRGQEIHVNGWAKKFLFSSDRLNLPISCLSGGERARLLIAKLMLQPADILFLDEPTNDLDIQTLEVIEESLKEFSGAVVLISHDRCLMDRLCNKILGLGEVAEFFADYRQWEKAVEAAVPKKKEATKVTSPPPLPKPQKKKLSYNEQRELDGMESAIEQVEKEISQLSEQIEQSDSKNQLEIYKVLGDAQKKLETLFDRWQILLEKNDCIS